METILTRLAWLLFDLLLPLMTGYALKQHNALRPVTLDRLIRTSFVVLTPVLAILSFWVLPLSSHLVWLPVLGVAITLIPCPLAWLYASRAYADELERGAYILSAMLANIGTLGGLCAFLLFGETGFAYVQLVAILQNMVLILVCFPIAQYFRDKFEAKQARVAFQIHWRKMFFSWNQLGVVGMAAGIALNVAGVARPAACDTLFRALVHVGAWLALLPVGYVIDFSGAHRYYPRIKSLVLLRFVLTPLLFYPMAHALFSDPTLLATLMLISLTPSAINAVVTSQLYRLNVDLPVASFLLTTTLFCVLIFPLFYAYLAWAGVL